jgi:hypothetical protein
VWLNNNKRIILERRHGPRTRTTNSTPSKFVRPRQNWTSFLNASTSNRVCTSETTRVTPKIQGFVSTINAYGDKKKQHARTPT